MEKVYTDPGKNEIEEILKGIRQGSEVPKELISTELSQGVRAMGDFNPDISVAVDPKTGVVLDMLRTDGGIDNISTLWGAKIREQGFYWKGDIHFYSESYLKQEARLPEVKTFLDSKGNLDLPGIHSYRMNDIVPASTLQTYPRCEIASINPIEGVIPESRIQRLTDSFHANLLKAGHTELAGVVDQVASGVTSYTGVKISMDILKDNNRFALNAEVLLSANSQSSNIHQITKMDLLERATGQSRDCLPLISQLSGQNLDFLKLTPVQMNGLFNIGKLNISDTAKYALSKGAEDVSKNVALSLTKSSLSVFGKIGRVVEVVKGVRNQLLPE